MTPIVFLDTETTGLSLEDDIWEFAGIRRDDNGEQELHLFIEHDSTKCAQLPDSFYKDHISRFPAACSGGVTGRERAAQLIYHFTHSAHIVGAVPNFDTERLERLMRGLSPALAPEWHYHLIDVENLAVGSLAALRVRLNFEPPWDSDALSEALGITPPGEGERHTAMGDARWAMRIYDKVMGLG